MSENRIRDALIAIVFTVSVISGVSILTPSVTPEPPPNTEPELSPREEKERRTRIIRCQKNLGLDESNFNVKVNDRFYAKAPPSLKGATLSLDPHHYKERLAWYDIAEDILREEAKRGSNRCPGLK